MESVFRITLIVGLVSSLYADYIPYSLLYEQGIYAYTGGDWKDAISSLEQAIESYRHYRRGLSNCYVKCNKISSGNEVVDKSSLGQIAARAACTKTCLNDEFGDFKVIGTTLEEVDEDFRKLMPYQYLQYAYYQDNELAKSVSTAYTYNLRFPENQLMKDNIKFFRENPSVTEDMYVNMEPIQHLIKYNQALEAYLKEEYDTAAVIFEEALSEYYKAVDECHGICEGLEASTDEQWEVDFFQQSAYHYRHVLECSLRCVSELSSEVAGKVYPNYVPLQYHYLQYAYFQAENFEKSCECAKSYLLFYPDNETMKKNLALVAENILIDDIAPRKEAAEHHKRMSLEAVMLQYTYQNFGIVDGDKTLLHPFGEEKQEKEEESETELEDIEEEEEDEEEEITKDTPYKSMSEKTDDIINRKDIEVEKKMKAAEQDALELAYAEPDDDVDITKLVEEHPKPGYQVIDSKYLVNFDEAADDEPTREGPLIFSGETLLANSTQLKGKERFAVDGIASLEDCQNLIDLGVSFGRAGDGYQGSESPHTKNEKFEGLTLLSAANMVKSGQLPLSAAKLYYDLSEKARAQVQAYFNLPHLYFDFTHLVCRTAKSDSPKDRNDLSHPIHADNCLLKNSGRCVKEPPAYIWRDYSAILYLNGNFEGGEFIFADSTARRVRTSVKPKCGRMVSFGAGGESLHGVKPVRQGRRCAVALWFTLSKEKREKHRLEAKRILDELTSKQKDEL